jgi:hypothetical protein
VKDDYTRIEKLDPEVKRLWLEKLRSGKYDQTQGVLMNVVNPPDKDKPAMCCLGVLCDVNRETGTGEWRDNYYHVGLAKSRTLLPEPVAVWAGLGKFNQTIRVPIPEEFKVLLRERHYRYNYINLANLNDGSISVTDVDKEDFDPPKRFKFLPWSFAKIADYIEEHL